MDTISGTLCLLLTASLFFYFRPREQVSLWLCALCALMGVLSPMLPAVTPFLQWVSILTKALALGCCYYQLSRELRERKADAARARRLAVREQRQEFPPAAWRKGCAPRKSVVKSS